MREKKVSIVIPCHHRVWQLEQCLESLGHTEYQNYEVICVVDGDSPESIPLAPGKVIADGKHRGVAGAVGLGWHEADGDILIEVDQDIIFLDPSWLRQVVMAFEDFPFLGLMACPVCPVYDVPKIWRSDRVAVRKLKKHGLNGATMSVSREAFETMGYPWTGPDKVGGHDYEYTFRARHCGFKTGYLHTENRVARQLTDAPEDAAYRSGVDKSKRRNTKAMRKRIAEVRNGAGHFVPFAG